MKHKKKKILTFGLFPKNYGGKHKSGIGIASFELLLHFSNIKKDEYEYLYASFDFKGIKKINRINIKGRNNVSLSIFVITHPYLSLKILNKIIKSNFSFYNILRYFWLYIFFQKIIHEYKPDLIHFNGSADLFSVNIIQVPAHTKIIAKIHGIYNSNKFLNKIERNIDTKKIDLLLFLTKEVKKIWFEKNGEPTCKTGILLNGINNQIFHYRPQKKKNNNFTLLTVGRLSENKGQLKAINAIIKSNIKNINYTCIGEDGENILEKLHLTAKKHNIKFTHIKYVNNSELPYFYAMADYLIQPSKEEGFGLSILESIACGTPVIIPNHIPIVKEDNIISDKNSILFKDLSTETIAKAIKQAYSTTFDRKSVSKTVSHLTWNKIAEQYNNFIKPIL